MNLNLEELVTLNEDPEETFELLDVIGIFTFTISLILKDSALMVLSIKHFTVPLVKFMQ